MTFTEEYFNEEINRFRAACGSKDFWAKTETQQEAMIKGLSLCYLNIVNPDGSQPTHEQIEKWALIFDAALMNYNQRKTFMAMLPLKRALGMSR